MMFRQKYLHLSDTSGMAILGDLNGEAAFNVWRSPTGYPPMGILNLSCCHS
jgi:hypothetical protein